MKKVKVNVVLVLFVFLVFALCGIGHTLQAAEPVKVGAIVSLTGWAGFLGTPIKESIEVAADEINGKGGVLGRQIQVFFEDDQSNPTNSVVAATKLIRDRKVGFLIGPSFTAGCMSILPICEEQQIPVMFPTPATAGLNKWVFHVLIDDTRHGKGMLDFMATTLKAKKIAILTGDEVGFMSGVKAIEDNIAQYGVTIVAKEQFKVNDTNMVPQLSKIKAANPDVILFYGIAPPASVAAKNYVQLGMKQPVVCSWGVASKDFAKLAGTVLKDKPWIIFGLEFLYGDKLPASDPYRKIYDPFVKAIRDKFNKEAQTFGANAYDALWVIAEAIKLANTDDRAAVRDAMEKVRFTGLVGQFACSPTDHYGMSIKAVVPQVIRDGEFYPYKK